jgi:predicted nucleic-acid-binding Zn-ribbon protein
MKDINSCNKCGGHTVSLRETDTAKLGKYCIHCGHYELYDNYKFDKLKERRKKLDKIMNNGSKQGII